MPPRTWLITGTPRGFGREWAAAALRRGDRVAGTARDPSTLDAQRLATWREWQPVAELAHGDGSAQARMAARS